MPQFTIALGPAAEITYVDYSESYKRSMGPPPPTSSPLLSPSKARQAAIQAKDWAYINSWLSRKYSPKPVPSFERNDDTLKTLLALAGFNEAADEEAELLHRAREEALEASKARDRDVDHDTELLTDVAASLSDQGARSLEELAETAISLGTLSIDVEEMGKGIIDLTMEEFDVAEQVRRVDALQTCLDRELIGLKAQIEELRSDEAFEAPRDLQQKTTEWTRSTKLLSIKIAEYKERIGVLERVGQMKGPKIEELREEELDVMRLQDEVKGLEGKVQTFYGLPPDKDAAKEEYENIVGELRSLKRHRDTLFEGLVETSKQS